MSRLDILPERKLDIQLKDIVTKKGSDKESMVLGIVLNPKEKKWEIRTNHNSGYEEEYDFIHRPDTEEKLEHNT